MSNATRRARGRSIRARKRLDDVCGALRPTICCLWCAGHAQEKGAECWKHSTPEPAGRTPRGSSVKPRCHTGPRRSSVPAMRGCLTVENPFKRPFPSDEFGGYGSDNVWRPPFVRADADWYPVTLAEPGWREGCSVPSAVSVTVDGHALWRDATERERQAHCDACRGCCVWWRRYSENPSWRPARRIGGAA